MKADVVCYRCEKKGHFTSDPTCEKYNGHPAHAFASHVIDDNDSSKTDEQEQNNESKDAQGELEQPVKNNGEAPQDDDHVDDHYPEDEEEDYSDNAYLYDIADEESRSNYNNESEASENLNTMCFEDNDMALLSSLGMESYHTFKYENLLSQETENLELL